MIASLVSMVFAVLTPAVLQYLKPQPWAPFIQHHAPTLNRITAIVIAIGQVAGVSFAFDATSGTLTIGGLVLSDMARIAATTILAFIAQELTYRLGVKQ